MTSEHKRKVVHISMVGFALLIGRLSPPLIMLCALTAVLFNIFVLPKVTNRGLERQSDLDLGFSLGMISYACVVLFLSGVFYREQVFLAVGWGAMAFGDGLAGLVGSHVKSPALPWNRDKSIAGLLAFVLLGGPLTIGLISLLPEGSLLDADMERWAFAIVIAMIGSALLETLPGMVDDNIIVPISAAVFTYILIHTPELAPWPADMVLGGSVVGIFTVLSILSRKIDIPGGLVGGLLAFFIYLGGGLNGIALLFAFFVLGTLASHFKKAEKEVMGTAQENKGQRTMRHALSNGGTAAFFGLMAWLWPDMHGVFVVMMAASLASATADTLSSELGTVYGKHFVNILTFKKARNGLDGVISLEGSLLGAAGAALISGIYLYESGDLQAAAMIAGSGIFGNVVDSILGASLQRKGLMSNDSVNAANTLAAAIFAGLCMGWLPFV